MNNILLTTREKFITLVDVVFRAFNAQFLTKEWFWVQVSG